MSNISHILKKLSTNERNTWCGGCTNNGILLATKRALADLILQKKVKQKDIVTVCDIGCGAKIFDYLNLSGFYSIHGRILPTALGIKISNPHLTVLAFGGDGGTYGEGVSHLVHNCRYNADITAIINDNQVFALTTGQSTPTTESEFRGPSTPLGTKLEPLNPIVLALESGATFVARGYALDVNHLEELIKKAIEHRGFSFIDVLQPCITFHNVTSYFQKNIYKLEEKKHNPNDFSQALKRAREWNYSFHEQKPVAIGVFYKTEKPLYCKETQVKKPFYRIKRAVDIKKLIREFK